MKAAVISAPGTVEVATVEDPAPGPREVVVSVAACGLCGTDLHILQGEFAPTLPVVPGHEFAGTVVATGSAVTELAEGDRVLVLDDLSGGKRENVPAGAELHVLDIRSPEAARRFAAQPGADGAIRLRRWDEAAKEVGAATPPLEHFRGYVAASLRR